MADRKSRNISNLPIKVQDVPDAPTVTATNVGTSRAFNNGAATVNISSPTGGLPTSYSITTTPTTSTTAGVSGANTITGLSSATSYTVSVTATNSAATSAAGTSSSLTATTVPQAPTIGTFTDGGTGTTGTLSFTAGATGGSSITNYKTSTDNVTFTALSPAQTSSPLSLSGLSVGTATYYLKAVNTNGDSAASSGVSGTVIQPTAFESIASVTGTGSSGTITFSSIPGTYQHLQIRIISKATRTASFGSNDGYLRFNSDTGSNYTYHYLIGDGSSASAAGGASQTSMRIARIDQSSYTGLSNMMAVGIIDIHDYANTSKNKTVRYFTGNDTNNVGDGQANLGSGLWMSTNAITSVEIFLSGTNYTTSTTFALYGVKGA